MATKRKPKLKSDRVFVAAQDGVHIIQGGKIIKTIPYAKDLINQRPVLKWYEDLKAKEGKVTIPEAGHFKFFVTCDRLAIFTTIGADNQHHASNKATKLFGPNWSQVRADHYFDRSYVFHTTGVFKELISTLPI